MKPLLFGLGVPLRVLVVLALAACGSDPVYSEEESDPEPAVIVQLSFEHGHDLLGTSDTMWVMFRHSDALVVAERMRGVMDDRKPAVFGPLVPGVGADSRWSFRFDPFSSYLMTDYVHDRDCHFPGRLEEVERRVHSGEMSSGCHTPVRILDYVLVDP